MSENTSAKYFNTTLSGPLIKSAHLKAELHGHGPALTWPVSVPLAVSWLQPVAEGWMKSGGREGGVGIGHLSCRNGFWSALSCWPCTFILALLCSSLPEHSWFKCMTVTVPIHKNSKTRDLEWITRQELVIIKHAAQMRIELFFKETTEYHIFTVLLC